MSIPVSQATCETTPLPVGTMHLASPVVLARNTGLNLLTTIWVLIVLIIAMPKLFSYLGETSFGMFSLAWIVIGYLSFLDVGVNRAATKFVSEYLAERDHESARQVVCTAVAANCFMGLAGGVAVVLVAPYLAGHFLHGSGVVEKQVHLVVYAVALAVPLLLVQGVFRAVLSSFQQFGRINAVDALATTLQWGAASVLAWKGYGVGWVVMSTVVARFASAVVYGLMLFRLFPKLGLFHSLHFHGLSKLVWFGGWVTVSQLVSPLLAGLDRLLIASFLSLTAVTFYFVPSEAIGRIRILPTSLAGTLYPAFSERGGPADAPQLQRLYGRSVRYLLLLLVPCAVYLWVLGPDLFSIWMGASFAQQTATVVRILAVGILANALAPVPYNLLHAMGRPDVTGKLHLLELPLYAVFCVALIPHWGITGAAIASTARFALDSVLLFWAASKYCQCSLYRVWVSAVPRILVLGCLLGLSLLAIRAICEDPWPRLLIGMAAVALSLLAGWFFATDSAEKPRIALAIRTLLGRPAL